MTENPGAYAAGTSQYRTFLDYRGIIICAVAKAWKDSVFWDELVADPQKALLKHFNYHFPYDLELSVNENSAEYRPDIVTDWKAIQFASITLMLPPAPENESERAIALAAYNLKHLTFLKKRPAPTISDILRVIHDDKELMHKIQTMIDNSKGVCNEPG